MQIEFMWKTDGSAVENCPALIRTDGGYFTQHKRVTDPEVRARLIALSAANGSPLGDDEDYGFVPADVIDRIKGL
jgi:hypothetical protein